MTVKEWLRMLPGMEARIRSKEAQIRKYREMATRATSTVEATRVSGTWNRSRVEDAVVRICDLEDAVRDELADLTMYRRHAMAVIRQVQDVRHRDILEMHYVNGWTFAQIAEEINCSLRWAQIMHGQALNDVREILRGMPETVRIYSLEIGA